jgi:hypothetical protein|tara:strand:- start:1206 stop:1439 length:234 start_codon:yes stop_codon:yes gene_type:complete
MSIKEDEFKQKSLKLLADPCKLKDSKYIPKNSDKLKDEIESKFKCRISDKSYNYILQEIEILVIVDSVLNDIISKIV